MGRVLVIVLVEGSQKRQKRENKKNTESSEDAEVTHEQYTALEFVLLPLALHNYNFIMAHSDF